MYFDKETKERLCRKSFWVFKVRWRWYKILKSTGATLEAVEAELDKILEQDQKILDEANRRVDAENKRRAEIRSKQSGPESTAKEG
jgi:uncharacterized protein YoxC